MFSVDHHCTLTITNKTARYVNTVKSTINSFMGWWVETVNCRQIHTGSVELTSQEKVRLLPVLVVVAPAGRPSTFMLRSSPLLSVAVTVYWVIEPNVMLSTTFSTVNAGGKFSGKNIVRPSLEKLMNKKYNV